MVARQSLGEHKPAVTTWQPNQPCRCSSSTTYRVPILQEFPCAKGKTGFLPFMLQRHNHKAYLDALQKRAGCAPRHLTQNSSEGTASRDTESWRSLPRMLLGFEMGTLKTNVLSSNDLGYAQQICVPKSLSPKSEYFQHCFWACVLWMQQTEGTLFFLLNGLIYLHPNVCFPAELLNCLTFRWMHSEQRAAPLSLI